MRNYINRLKIYFAKRKENEAWKAQKRIKWIAEGRSEKEVDRQLKVYKIYFPLPWK